MSTRMLTNPGARHTITDDFESHFFVLMWTALHLVKHDQAGNIDMEYIFDQQASYGGISKGGAGKVQMYQSKSSQLLEVEFACKPFNDLFWALWRLFAKYLRERWGAAIDEEPGKRPFNLQA